MWYESANHSWLFVKEECDVMECDVMEDTWLNHFIEKSVDVLTQEEVHMKTTENDMASEQIMQLRIIWYVLCARPLSMERLS